MEGVLRMTFQEAYPRDAAKQVEQHLRDVWSGKVKSTYSCIHLDYLNQRVPQETVEKAAENILRSAQYPGYNPPRYMVDCSTISTAAYWGGKRLHPVNGNEHIETIIHSPEDIADAKPGNPEEGEAKAGIEMFGRVCQRLGTEDLYCTTIDFQGPLNTAALLWEQTDFMVSMITEPEVVHEFLDQVTTQLIAVIRKTIENSGHRVCSSAWPYIWLPDDIGVVMTEDYMPLISADMYREFGIPYVERISREFGGLFLHCCGKYDHQIENLKNASIHLLGLEFHYPFMKPETLFEAFGDSVLFVPYFSMTKGIEDFPTLADYFLHLQKVKRDDTRLWFVLDPADGEFDRQLEVVKGIVGE